MHVVVKAVSEEGERLNIRKATLREWRSRLAEQLRAHGISANATERAPRGQSRSPLKTGIYRSAQRGQSRYLRERMRRIEGEMREGRFEVGEGKWTMLETRRTVVAGYEGAADVLLKAGRGNLAQTVREFVAGMTLSRTTNEQLAAALVRRVPKRRQVEPREYSR